MEFDDTRCGLCGETFRETDEVAEMYDPTADSGDVAVICHADCGLSRGFEVA